MKVATAAVILGVALVTGALWLHNHDARVRETAAAVRSADSESTFSQRASSRAMSQAP